MVQRVLFIFKMDEEKLILLVQNYQELYDQSDSNYHNQLRRQNIWEEIGDQMEKIGDDCRKKWGQIRDNYRKAIKSRTQKSGQAASHTKPIRFEKELQFMKEFLGDRKQITNIHGRDKDLDEDLGDSMERDSIENIFSPPVSTSSSGAKRSREESSSQSALKEYLAYKRSKVRTDHLTKYFQSLEETVRTFPQKLQIEAKMKISNIIHEMELRSLLCDERSMHQNNSYTPSPVSASFPQQHPLPPTTPQYTTPPFSSPDLPGPHRNYASTSIEPSQPNSSLDETYKEKDNNSNTFQFIHYAHPSEHEYE